MKFETSLLHVMGAHEAHSNIFEQLFSSQDVVRRLFDSLVVPELYICAVTILL